MALAKLIVWSNGMVMAYDKKGRQVRSLQGNFKEVMPKALRAVDSTTEVSIGDWRNGRVETNKECIQAFLESIL